MKVAVSFLSSDDYKECIQKIENSKADFIHVDFCDGKYVESKNITMKSLCNIIGFTKKRLDVHLMAMDPDKYFDDLSLLNIETITFHPKASKNVFETINKIKNMGIKVGLAINPDEDILLVKEYLAIIDEVLVMSVVPGKGGQSFIETTLDTVDMLSIEKDKYHYIIAMDGGVNNDTITKIKEKNVDLVISGSYINKLDSFNEGINLLK